MEHFKLYSQFAPSGDQPQAIDKLVNGIKSGKKEQILLGVTVHDTLDTIITSLRSASAVVAE